MSDERPEPFESWARRQIEKLSYAYRELRSDVDARQRDNDGKRPHDTGERFDNLDAARRNLAVWRRERGEGQPWTGNRKSVQAVMAIAQTEALVAIAEAVERGNTHTASVASAAAKVMADATKAVVGALGPALANVAAALEQTQQQMRQSTMGVTWNPQGIFHFDTVEEPDTDDQSATPLLDWASRHAAERMRAQLDRIRELCDNRKAANLGIWSGEILDILDGPPPVADEPGDLNDLAANGLVDYVAAAQDPPVCPAHGPHPHGGRRCLDCPECNGGRTTGGMLGLLAKPDPPTAPFMTIGSSWPSDPGYAEAEASRRTAPATGPAQPLPAEDAELVAQDTPEAQESAQGVSEEVAHGPGCASKIMINHKRPPCDCGASQ